MDDVWLKSETKGEESYMFDLDDEKKSLKNELTDFIDAIEEDRIKAEDLYDDLSKEDGTGEECIRLKDFLDAEPSCFKNAEKLLDEVYDAKTERDIERLRKKFNDLHNKYGSAREHDYLGQNGFY